MASKGTIALQLQINTIFKDTKSAVAELNKSLQNIKIDKSITNDFGSNLIKSIKEKGQEIQDVMQKINGTEYTGVNDKYFNDLFKSLSSKIEELKQLQDNLKQLQISNKSQDPSQDLATAKNELVSYQTELQKVTKTVDTLEERLSQLDPLDQAQAYQNVSSALQKFKAQQDAIATQVVDQKKKIADLTTACDEYAKKEKEVAQAQTDVQEAQKDINKVLEEADRLQTAGLDSMTGIKKATTEHTKEINEQAAALKAKEKTEKEANQATEEYRQAQIKITEAEKQATEATKERISALEQDTTKTLIEYQSAANQGAKSTNDLSAALESSIVKWGSFTAIVRAAINAVQDIVSTYQELDDNLSAISAVSGITTESLWGNMPQMIDNANSLALSVDDLTNGMLLFYQQGLSTEETEIRLNAAGKMAAISQQDLSTAVDQLTSTMNAFGMSGDDAANVVDVFANMAGKTATDVEELATAMARTASIAKNAGMTFEQTTAFIATMEETTRLSAETIGNSMKSIIARFQKLKADPESLLEDGVNANDVEKALKKANVALRDTEGNFRNIGDVIMELSAKWDTLDTNTQKYIATMAAGTQQSSNFIALVGNNQSNIDNLAYAMDAAGAAEQQFSAVSDNLSSALKRLDNNFTALKTSFFNSSSSLTSFVNLLASAVDALAKIPGPIKEISLVMTALTLIMTKHNLQVQKRIQSAYQEVAVDAQSYAQKIADAQGNQAEITAILENVDAHARLIAAKKGLNQAETEELVTKAKSAVANAAEAKELDVITKELNKGSVSLANFGSQGVGIVSALKASFTSLFSFISTSIAEIGALAMANPVLATIGVALAAVTAGVAIYTTAINEESKAIQENIDKLKEEQETLSTEQQKHEENAQTLSDYADKLKEAYKQGQDLTDIKKELAEKFSDEQDIVNATQGSYEDLANTLDDVIKREEELAKQKKYESAVTGEQERAAETDKFETAWNQKNPFAESKRTSSRTYVDRDSGKELTEEEAHAQHNKVNSKVSWDAYKAANFDEKITYTLTNAKGKKFWSGTEEEYKEKIKELAQNFYSADDAFNMLAQSGEASGDAVADTQKSKILSLISQFGDSPFGEDGKVTDVAKEQAQAIQDTFAQAKEELGVSFDDFYNFLLGNYSSLSDKAYQDISNFVVNLNAKNQQALEDGLDPSVGDQIISNAADNYEQHFQDAFSHLADYDIISEDDARNLSEKNLNLLVEAFDAGGKDAAKTLLDLIQGNLDDALKNIKIEPDDLEGVIGQLETAIGDSIENLDTSDLSNTLSQLFSAFDNGDINTSQFILALQAIASTSDEANAALSPLISSLQSLSAASQDSFTSMESVSQTWSDFGTNLSYIQQLASDTGISLDELKSVAEALGMSVDEMIASGNLTQIGEQFFANAEDAETWANSLMGLTDSQLAQAQAEQEAVAANAQAAATELASRAADLEAKAADIEATGAEINANNELIDSQGNVILSADELADAQKQVNEQFEATTPAVKKHNVANNKTASTYSELAAEVRAYASSLKSQSAEQKSAADAATAKASYIANLRTQLQSAKKDWQNYGKAAGSGSKGGGGSGGSGSAADNVNEATEALEKQKKALQEQEKALEKSKQALEDQKKALEDQKKALEETNKQLQENYKLYVELIKSRLNNEIDRQTTRIEAFYDAIKDTIQSEIDSFNDQLDALKKQADELKSKADELQDAAEQQEDSLNKLYDAAQAYYDAAQDGLDNQIDSYDKVIDRNKEHIDLLNEQKDAIQDQIDALDTAADSESKLLALEKARDALANARNQKTRMVLTNGGGWRLRTDKSEISNAQSNLASAQRDYQKEILERQQKKIEEQTDEIEKQNDNLENIKSDLEDQKDALDDIKDQWDKAQDALGKTTSELEEQTNLIRQFQYGNDASRQDQLSNFSGQVSNNNQQQQAASDATNRANEASNKYDQQSNEDVQGSIAEAIKKLEEQQNQADEALKKYFENQLSNNAETAQIQQEMKDLINQMVNGQIGQLENFAQFYETINGALEQANTNASQTADYINNINAAIDRYDEWSNRLDMTTDEINQRQAIMNEINNATLGSLLEGGSTFGQLQEQYEQIVRNNDEAKRIQGQIDGLDEQANVIQTQINALKEQENKISEQEKELSNANSNKTANAAKAAGNTAASGAKTAGSGIQTNADKNAGRIVNAINSKDISVTIQETSKGSGGGSGKYLMARYNTGGMLGFSHGGVDDVTTVAAVHGSKNRPELVLNNSQSAALFKYIDSMTRIPTLSSAGSARNALMGFNTTNNTNNNGTNFTNCEFNVESNADNLDSLVQDLKQSASIRR